MLRAGLTCFCAYHSLGLVTWMENVVFYNRQFFILLLHVLKERVSDIAEVLIEQSTTRVMDNT